ncbi:MAG: hypothetical protein WBB43_06090 [Limnoraphis sp.]
MMGLQTRELNAFFNRRIPDIHSTSIESLNQHKLHQKQRLEKTAQILQKIKPRLLSNYLNWYIAIEAETGVYFLDPDYTGIFFRSKIYFPKSKLSIYQLNQSNYFGKI